MEAARTSERERVQGRQLEGDGDRERWRVNSSNYPSFNVLLKLHFRAGYALRPDTLMTPS